jgi:hypothetical protein
MPAAEPTACVFCGEPIGPGEEVAGRAPMAAHAACADAALTDDEHWDAVSQRATGGGAGSTLDKTPRVGCLGVSTGALLLAVGTVAALRG